MASYVSCIMYHRLPTSDLLCSASATVPLYSTRTVHSAAQYCTGTVLMITLQHYNISTTRS